MKHSTNNKDVEPVIKRIVDDINSELESDPTLFREMKTLYSAWLMSIFAIKGSQHVHLNTKDIFEQDYLTEHIPEKILDFESHTKVNSCKLIVYGGIDFSPPHSFKFSSDNKEESMFKCLPLLGDLKYHNMIELSKTQNNLLHEIAKYSDRVCNNYNNFLESHKSSMGSIFRFGNKNNMLEDQSMFIKLSQMKFGARFDYLFEKYLRLRRK